MKKYQDIEFIGDDKVALPAEKVWCGVIEPSGVVVGMSTSEHSLE